MQNMKERDRIFRSWKKSTGNIQERNVLRDRYKRLRNEITNSIKIAKQRHYQNAFNDAKHDMKQTWKIINKVMGKSKADSDDLQIFDAFRAYSNESKMDLVNDFADKLFEKSSVQVHSCSQTLFEHLPVTQKNSIYVPEISTMEIVSIIEKQQEKKSAGHDQIKPRDLKDISSEVAPYMERLINNSINIGRIEKGIKYSIIRPIYKNGKRNDVNNYRPISLLPVVSKIIERYMEDILYKYFKKNNIIDLRQFAYQREKGTTQLLEMFVDRINQSLDRGIHMICIFVDFKSAFDTINHTKLLQILESVGIRGNILGWFKSYITERTYSIKLGQYISESKAMERGVPQGSILGPLLYLLYVNDVGKCFKLCNYYSYADDILITCRHVDLESAQNNLQSEFNTFMKWAHDKELIINRKKTKVMHIRTPKMKSYSSINILAHTIECVHKNYYELFLCREIGTS